MVKNLIGNNRREIVARAVWLMLVPAFLLAACGGPLQATQQSTSALPLSDCTLDPPAGTGGMAIKARCGTLKVAEDPADPAGRQIELHLAVLPATSRNPETDPLFLLAGGPGQAATEAFAPLISVFNPINSKRDLVLVDQRGTGKSNPLVCPTPAATPATAYGAQIPMPTQLAEMDSCLEAISADVGFYTTEISTGDLEAVRQALGYGRINLLGISYGTRLAQVYASLYPQSIRTLTLDSVTPLGWALGSATDSDSRRAIGLVFKRCAEDEACGKAFPKLDSRLEELLADLQAAPQTVDLRHPSTSQPVQVYLNAVNALSTLRMLAYSSEYASLLPLLVSSAANGDLQPLAAQLILMNESMSGSISDALYFSVICSEDVPFLLDEAAGATDYLSAGLPELRQLCERWPSAEVPDEILAPAEIEAPALLLSGEFDPVTPPGNAEIAASYMPNSRSIVVPGSGHNVLYRGCLPRLIRQFLEEGSAQELDDTCVQGIEPIPYFLSPVNPQP